MRGLDCEAGEIGANGEEPFADVMTRACKAVEFVLNSVGYGLTGRG